MKEKNTSKQVSKARTTKAKKTAIKKVVKAEKQDSAIEEMNMESSKSSKKGFSLWPLFSLILLILVVGMVAHYKFNAFSGLFNAANTNSQAVNTNTSNTNTQAETKTPVVTGEPFQMELTAVYNTKDQNQSDLIKTYSETLEKALQNTKVSIKTVDYNSEEGKKLLADTKMNYIPLLVSADNITSHPQYADFSRFIEERAGMKVIKSDAVEFLSAPEAGDGRIVGADPAKAKVRIVEYQSMTCGYCAMMHPIFENLVAKNKNVSWVIKHYDRGGPDSYLAQGAECAGDQGKFKEMLSYVFKNQSVIYENYKGDNPEKGLNEFFKIASKAVGINGDNVVACIESKKYESKIEKATLEAQEFNIAGTPSFFVNKQFVGGYIDENQLNTVVEAELKK